MQSFRDELVRRISRSNKDNIKQLYAETSRAVIKMIKPIWTEPKSGKTACYFSAEFLIGRVVYANLYNLGLLEEMQEVFKEQGLDPNQFEAVDDAALGNGGLGRLAACFLDSGASCGYNLDGYGIRYRYGLFKQYFQNGFQQEEADNWLRFGDPWSIRREDQKLRINFKDQSVWAVPYDMPVIGYDGSKINTLRLWQAEPLKSFDFDSFNRQDYEAAYKDKNDAAAISAVLYPNDDSYAGKCLRLKQQYFFSAASLQSIILRYKGTAGHNISGLAAHFAIQLNDTHPTVAIPELLRLLMTQEQLDFYEAFEIVERVFAYTNHTIMAEALEKWDVNLFCDVLPELYPYVVMLQNHLSRSLHHKGLTAKEVSSYNIIDNGHIQMAHMAIFAGHSTNGVAALHTDILKTDTLKNWYNLFPQRFNNKTNGITQRRWLGLCNPELSNFITQRIGDGWLTDLYQLEKLLPYANDAESLRQLADIKDIKKRQLADHVRIHEYGFELNCSSMFDIQIKRLHEYKRQLLNAFSILDIYFGLKEGSITDLAPITCLFGAKAAPGYKRAKAIIKLINEIGRVINSDPETKDRLQLLFVQNYNVSYAEKLIPAADLSEQISTAGTEASGTGNMKLMLNGAPTLGTYDGANIEIVEAAGAENNYIFGARVDDIEAAEASGYDPLDFYNSNPRIRRVMDSLIDGSLSDGGTGAFRDIYDSILGGIPGQIPDQYYLLLDFESYTDAKLSANTDWKNREAYTRKSLYNIARSGKFSSDRTISEYATDIWEISRHI